jgi:DNA replication terminus site-binding protein
MEPYESIKYLMAELNVQHSVLLQLISDTEPKFVAFNIQTISKKDEASVITDGIQSLEVKSLEKRYHLSQILGFWSKYYKEDGVSTQFVERMPGLVVVSSKKQEIRYLTEQINSLKIKISKVVRNGRDHIQRHKFIHDAFPRIMTDQLYRKIHVIDNNVQRVWFNWTSRPIPRLLSNEQAVILLKKHEYNPSGLMTSEEWRLMIKAQIEDIRCELYSRIYVKKDFRLLPVLTYKEEEGKGIFKRKTKNGCTPMLLLAQDSNSLPLFTHLESYHKPTMSEHIPLVKLTDKVYINAYLKLIGIVR